MYYDNSLNSHERTSFGSRLETVVAPLITFIKLLYDRTSYCWHVLPYLGARYGKIYLSLTSQPGQLSLAIPPWVEAMSTTLWAVMLSGWGVKAAMARVWWLLRGAVMTL